MPAERHDEAGYERSRQRNDRPGEKHPGCRCTDHGTFLQQLDQIEVRLKYWRADAAGERCLCLHNHAQDQRRHDDHQRDVN